MNAGKTCVLLLSLLGFSCAAWAQRVQAGRAGNPLEIRPFIRVTEKVDLERRIRLTGHIHPLTRAGRMIGELASDERLEGMVLVLRPDAAQQEALDELIRAQQDPGSPYYHQWLTPAEYGERFGVAQEDLDQIVRWIEMEGMKVEEIPASRRAIVFSGSAGQVEAAFHTRMRRYAVNGRSHYSNATDPEIPEALAQVVQGVVSLHDFRSTPTHAAVTVDSPAYNLANGVNLLMPRDWATIYDVTPLYGQGLDGTGQSIAVVGRTDLALTDVQTFRSNAGLAAKDPQKIFVNGVNPGWPDCEDEAEAALDVEWAGALAKNATIKYVSAKSGATDGIILAAQYAVNNNIAPIVTVSYLHCENTLSDGGRSLWGALWSQAATQGQSIFVASGDSGAAGCDLAIAKTATQGVAVNAICSSPNSTCVGGTQFNEGQGVYWSSSNGTGQGSVLSYIPEAAWNETGWSGMINTASGGGVSTVYAKPDWQSATGVPAGNMRYVPDIAASSAIHDAYVIQIQGKPFYIAGTSAASPSLASVMALVMQKAGARLGNVNPALYTLANQQAAGGPAVFHDIISGNNSVPGVSGYNAGAGYDLVTGLGSVDAFLLVNSWSNSVASNFSLSTSVGAAALTPGTAKTANISLTAQNGFNSPVTLAATGAPAGVSVTLSPTKLTAAVPVTMTVTAAASAVAGSNSILITGSGGGFTRTLVFNLTIAKPSFTLAPSATTASLAPGSSTAIPFTIARSSGFNSAVSMSVSRAPAGVAATFLPVSIASSSSTSTLTLSAANSAAAGTFVLTVTASGGGVTQTQALSLTVLPGFTLTASATSASVAPSGFVTVNLTTDGAAGFKSAIALSVSGLPQGVTASFTPTSIASPGSGISGLKLTAASGAAAGTSTLTITATGGNVTKIQNLTLTVSVPSFTLMASGSNVNINAGGSLSITLRTAVAGGFKSAIAFSISALPKGVTASFTPTSIASPGSGTSTLKLAAASGTAVGSCTLTVTASGGGVRKTQTLNLRY